MLNRTIAESQLTRSVSTSSVLISVYVTSLNVLVRHLEKAWISRKIKALWEKVIVQRQPFSSCATVILTRLWILTGVKVKNCHQISHWFQLVLPATKQPLSVCDHWLVLILQACSITFDCHWPTITSATRLPVLLHCSLHESSSSLLCLPNKRLLIRFGYASLHMGLRKVKQPCYLTAIRMSWRVLTNHPAVQEVCWEFNNL